jgi:hypothetical protein
MVCTTDTSAVIDTAGSFNTWKAARNTALEAPSPDIDAERKTIFSMASCLEDRISNLSTLSTDDAKLKLDIANLEKEIKAEEANVATSKQRLELMKGPISNYTSWFPMSRPLRPITKPILIGIGVFMILISVTYLRSIVRVGDSSYLLTTFPALAAILGQLTPAFWMVFITLVGVIIYFTRPKK